MNDRRSCFAGIRTCLHALDYELLPLVARLPLPLGYAYARLRGQFNATAARDWRSVALGTAHIQRQTALAWQEVFPDASAREIDAIVKERFVTESREEFEAALLGAHRLGGLRCEFEPPRMADTLVRPGQGSVLLSSHFDSCMLGAAFLGRAGLKVSLMVSSVYQHERVAQAVQRLFDDKYRGMEMYLNGGKVLYVEEGLSPFYELLQRGETLIVLADAPPTGTTCCMPQFLGARRKVAAAGLLLAQNTASCMGAFLCYHNGIGRYRIVAGPFSEQAHAAVLDDVFAFFTRAMRAAPGKWWAADLLPAMPVVAGEQP